MEIMHAHWIFYRRIAELIARAIRDATLDTAAGHHVGERLDVVIAAIARLRHRRTAELAAENDQRVVQHSALLSDP